jgi:hypothetical protein
VIKKLFGLAALLAGLVFATLASAQQIEVNVDRTELARGETLTFTIRVFDQRQGMQLDLTPLTENFDVLGTRTSSQIRSVNGNVESWTDYIVTLFPLTEGELEIPSLEINNSSTDPIIVNVVNEGPRSNQSSEELFLEVEVNKESVYVQEQLLFTVRLYYTINGIRNPQFTELEMEDTVIQLIGSPNQYERLIDGVRYGVYEKRYVIFPQRSGPLEIPDILFRGEVTDGSSNFVFRNLNTRRVTAFIDGLTIDVKERPDAARDSQFWLPVSSLTLEESFDTDISNLQVGDSIVRKVTLVAEGVDGAVLPPFSNAQIQGANLYPDPPEIDRTFVDGEIIGSRTEQTTIVATQGGMIEIPEIVIPWWNVDTDQLEATVVPATRLQIAAVQGDVPSEQAVAGVENIQELLQTVPVVDQSMIEEQAQAEFIEVNAGWLNTVIGIAFAVVLLSIYWLVLRPNQAVIAELFQQQKARIAAYYDPRNNEGVAFKRLATACSLKDRNRIRETLIQWCRHFIGSRRINSMEDILQQQEAPQLHDYARALQSELWNSNGSGATFDATALLRTVNELRRQGKQVQKQQAQDERYALPPLYKT